MTRPAVNPSLSKAPEGLGGDDLIDPSDGNVLPTEVQNNTSFSWSDVVHKTQDGFLYGFLQKSLSSFNATMHLDIYDLLICYQSI